VTSWVTVVGSSPFCARLANRRFEEPPREVAPAEVGRLIAELCGDAFVATTGAQIPVDGGNERVV
jgi:NAD(P)-dependent dehydrogenase (short-subunit alcohol dehydrogenase family)